MHYALLSAYNFIDITEQGYEQYQDIIINNCLVKPASAKIQGLAITHNCEARYQIIKNELDKYKRPFTVLDIGASQGFYSFKIAYNFPNSVCVMIEGDNHAYPLVGTQLEQLCYLNTALDNIILLKHSLVLSDVQRLSECEHFDVVLALNIIHWFPSEWKKMADAIINMGDNIIIETPPQETSFSHIRYDIEQYILSKGGEVIGIVPRHTSGVPVNIYLIKANKNKLIRNTWIAPLTKKKHIIKSSYTEKKLIKTGQCDGKEIISDWAAGINLITFKMYYGAYPSNDCIKDLCKTTMSTTNNNDCLPNNLILQGKKLIMIDLNDKNFYCGKKTDYGCCQKRLKATLKWLDLENRTDLEQFFYKTLCKPNAKIPAKL